MKWFLFCWAAPLAFLGGWYALSYYDLNFGIFILSRQAHDLVFEIYGNFLGMDPKAVPLLVARALAVDTLYVFALMAFRRRKAIISWLRARNVLRRNEGQLVLVRDDNLSSAP